MFPDGSFFTPFQGCADGPEDHGVRRLNVARLRRNLGRVEEYQAAEEPAQLAALGPDIILVDPNTPAEYAEAFRKTTTAEQEQLFGIDKLNIPRSELPAITHVDYSARVQTVHADTNPRYHALLKAFESKTGCAVLVNTSFNVRGEPIVCTPHDAYRCFMRTEMDYLVMGSFLLDKALQQKLDDGTDWRTEFALD